MKIHLGQGTTLGAVTVFPVWHGGPAAAHRPYTTRTTHLAMSETDGGPTVAALSVTNLGPKPVLVLEGQLFEGGWQHRMALHSTLVPTGQALPLEVACVEQHRWAGETGQRTRGRRATTVVRAGYDAGGQHEVWSRVDRMAAGDAARPETPRSATGSLSERLAAPDLDRLVDRLVRRAPVLSGQCGVLLGVGGQPLALELFDHPRTLREQYRPLLRAALLDGLEAPAVVTPGRRARRFVARLEKALRHPTPHTPPVDRSWGERSTARSTDIDAVLLRTETGPASAPVHLRSTFRRHPLLAAA